MTGQSQFESDLANRGGRTSRSFARARAALSFRLDRLSTIVPLIAALAGCDPAPEYLGLLQVRVSAIDMPDSIAVSDTLVAYLNGRPDVGNCFGEGRADVQRDLTKVSITVWADASQYHGANPPPCGVVSYRYEGAPPFTPGWFVVLVNQPDGAVFADSVRVAR